MTRKEYNHIAKTVSGKLYSYLKKSLKDGEVADDLVQESYAKLWENHQNLKVEQAEKWLFTTGYRLMLNWLRDNKRISRIDDVKYDEPEQHSNYETREWIEKGLDALTKEQKRIILLRDMQGYSYKEIEEITNLKESQVKVYLFRARKKLKEILSNLSVML